MSSKIATVGIVGAGQMGSGIAHVAALAGYKVLLHDVSAEQIQAVLGSGPLAQFAEKLGVDPAEAASHISQLLPQVVDHLTPNGSIPDGALGALEGLLDRFKR